MAGDSHSGDIIDPEAYSVAELRAMVFKGKGRLSRPLALALLGRKRYPGKVSDLSRLLMDEEEVPRLRNMAGQLLGRAGTPAAARALDRGLAVKNELALRGVLEGLSLAGGADTPKVIGRLKRRKGLVGRVASRAAGLLSYRFARRGNELAAPDMVRELRVSPRRAAPIEVTKARGARVTAATTELATVVSGVKLTGSGAVALRCAGRELLLLFDEAAQAGGLERFADRKTLAGIVAEYETLEGEGWEVKYHVLTEPQKNGSVRLVVATARGVPVCTGTAKIKGERARFSLRTVDRPGAVAIDIKGEFERGRLTFSQARSNLRRRPSSLPQPLAPAGGRSISRPR